MSGQTMRVIEGGAPDGIKPRDRDAVIMALRAGVVPRSGLQHVQVGRVEEVKQTIKDTENIADGGAVFRVIVGDYGCGKTFFLSVARAIAMQRRLVTLAADFSPDRRLHSATGHARALYSELMRNMATRTKPDGGALENVVERFIVTARAKAEASGAPLLKTIAAELEPLQDMVSGFDFTHVIRRYADAVEEGNDGLRSAALRWLRGEFALKSEARDSLGVRTIIEDTQIHDYVKLMAGFVRLAGFTGLLVVLDEAVNLYKLTNAQARTTNYEQILRILNDTLQGTAAAVGFYIGGTPEFLMDPRRGLYSYEALRSRLAENTFARSGLVDLSGPVLRLQALTREELLVLLQRLRHIHAGGDPARYLVPDDALTAFLAHSEKRLGAAAFRTPRNTIKAFLDLLAILDQNTERAWHDLIPITAIEEDRGALVEQASDEDGGDNLSTFRL